jgi:hypothetical protein
LFNGNATRIIGPTGPVGLTIENLSAITGQSFTINNYFPPLRIYKHQIGSAISLPANTAESALYPIEMTLKATTQYMLNLSYSGLTENNNTSFYIYFKIHKGTTPLDDTNIVGIVQFTNTTGYSGNGASTSFMTDESGVYTGRFYVRNTSTTVSLTIANLQASVIEVV